MPGLFVRFGEGGSCLPGNSRDPMHLGWFEAESLSFPATTAERRHGDLRSAASACAPSRVRIGLPFNASSCNLYTAAANQRCFAVVEIEWFNRAENRPFLRYLLKNGVLGSCDALPDGLFLNVSCESMRIQYLSSDGKTVPNSGWDIKSSLRV